MKDPFSLDDPIRPRKRVTRLTEGKIQEKCVAYARSRGYWARKFSSASQRGVPDYLFGKNFENYVELTTQRRGHSVKWAEEFKAPKKTSSKKQLKEQNAMTAAGWKVIRDTGTNGQADIDEFKRRIDDLEKQHG